MFAAKLHNHFEFQKKNDKKFYFLELFFYFSLLSRNL